MMNPQTPETYFNENFRGKTETEQKLEINKLEKEIQELKKKCDLYMKHLNYAKRVLHNNIEVNEVKELTIDDVFTVENKKDPFWESEAREVVKELAHSLYSMSIDNEAPVFFSEIIAHIINKENSLDIKKIFE